MRQYPLLILLFLLLFACKPTPKFTIDTIPDPMEHHGYVSNPDHIVNDATTQQLDEQMRKMDQAGTAQVAVVLLNTIGNNVPKDIAHAIFRKWKPGDKEKNNGLVVLLVKDQHRIEMETGYGLEGPLPDVICFRIENEVMIPFFKKDDYDNGMISGMANVENILEHGFESKNENADIDSIWRAADSTEAYAKDSAALANDTSMNELSALADSDSTTAQDSTFTDYNQAYAGSDDSDVPLILFWYILYIIFSSFVLAFRRPRNKISTQPNPLTTRLFTRSAGNYFFVLGFPAIELIVYHFVLEKTIRWYTIFLFFYFAWLGYHLYKMFMIHRRMPAQLYKTGRKDQYEVLEAAWRGSTARAIFFPIPFLLYNAWYKRMLHKIRYAPCTCQQCQQPMELITGNHAHLLNKGQLKEEELKSVQYDVWTCAQGHSYVVGYENPWSKVNFCSACKCKTTILDRTDTISRPTTYRNGSGIEHFKCQNCGHDTSVTFVIPKLRPVSTSDSSSSSSSSSSGGSWGGGSSGGGGAGSSW
jgi:uncharacterized protein